MAANPFPFDDRTSLYRLGVRFWPEIAGMNEDRQVVAVGDVLTVLYSAPLAILGISWLLVASNFSILIDYWSWFLAAGILIGVLRRLNFFLIIELRENRYGSADGSLDSAVLWSVLLLFGPTGLWLSIFWVVVFYLVQRRKAHSKAAIWNQRRGFALELAGNTLNYLTGLAVYAAIGGTFPIQNLNQETFLPAIMAVGVTFVATLLIWSGYILYGSWTQIKLSGTRSVRTVVWFFVLALGLPVLAQPFGIILAGLVVESGLFVYGLLTIGLLVVAYLTRHLSWLAETSRQQSRILEKLEALGRALLTTPPGIMNLAKTVHTHVPNMFPARHLAIWTLPDQVLYQYPEDWRPALAEFSAYLRDQSGTRAFLSGEILPWLREKSQHPLMLTPIHDAEDNAMIGGIYVELRALAQPWSRRTVSLLFPAIQSLAAQIASSIHQTDLYAQTLNYQKVSQELRFAGQIQASLLPFRFPSIPGWQLAVTLDPAEETSGDFFDIIPLEEDRLGIVIADVADKGVGPALYMALSRTLIRTYAVEFEEEPDIVFFAANERILKDTDATNLFVTAFYGILDLKTGTLTYANAGHNPPYLIGNGSNPRIVPLQRTGIPIGIEEGVTWEHDTIQLEPGEVLILYTDGIPDAQDEAGQFFGEGSLVDIGLSCHGETAEEVQRRILAAVNDFMGDAPQFDDITLIVLYRDT